MQVNLLYDYRGRLTDDKLLLKGVHDVSQELGELLIRKNKAVLLYDDDATISALEQEVVEPLNYDGMTVVELRQYADDNNIDLGNRRKKSSIIRAIKDA